MKIALTASYRAVPSILMVAPTGRMKRVILLSTCRFSSKHRNVMGRVAALKVKNICKYIEILNVNNTDYKVTN